MCPRNIAHEPPKDARVNFGIHILTKTEVYSHFQQSRKKHQSNTKVSPHLFFRWATKSWAIHTAKSEFLSHPPAGPLFVHTLKKPKMSHF